MTDAPRDPYHVLGVAPTATAAELAGAYRKLVRHLHPDADAGADPRALEQVLAAYDLLRDPERRAAHDRERNRASGQGHPRAYTATDNPSGTRRTVRPTRHDTPVTDVPVRREPGREPDLRAGPVRRHR